MQYSVLWHALIHRDQWCSGGTISATAHSADAHLLMVAHIIAQTNKHAWKVINVEDTIP